mgnify:CR=1 FL=1
MDLTSTSLDSTREAFLVVDIERFRGPLDLLLHLIRQQDLDIFEIPISKITNEFLSAIGSISPSQIDNAGEFMEMAANLLRIKAQMLLPQGISSQEEDPRAELVYRLLEYEQIQEIRAHLSLAESYRGRQFGKGYVTPREDRKKQEITLTTTWDELYTTAISIAMPSMSVIDHKITTRLVAMEDKVDLILLTLQKLKRIEFSKLLEPFETKMHGVMTFLAGLELARNRKVRLRQAKMFSELWVYRFNDAEPEPAELDSHSGEE